MAVLIKVATTADEIDALFRGRHAVYAQEDAYFSPRPDGRIHDRFDAFPTTTNLIAKVGDDVVGGVRLVEQSGAGTPADEFFDFSPHVPPGARVASGSMLWLRKEYRSRWRMTSALMALCHAIAMRKGVSHFVGTLNPEIEQAFFKFGYRPVGEVAFQPEKKLPFRPALLNMGDLTGLARLWAELDAQHYALRSSERLFVPAGEAVFREGEDGDACFVVVEGEVRITIESTGGVDIARLTSGELFGEMALLTDRPRMASAIADTDLHLMVVRRTDMLAQLKRDPDLGYQMLRILAERLKRAQDRPSQP